MTVLLHNNKTAAVLAVNMEKNKAETVMQNAKWIITHISSTQADVLLYDLRVVMPFLDISDATAILAAYDPNTENSIPFFVNVCNILAKRGANTFWILPSTDFHIC